MNQSRHPFFVFTRKLKEHHIHRSSRNRKMIRLIYLKILLSEPFRLMERKKYKLSHTNQTIPPDNQPVFIIGHWRSGTTYLHNLLSKDPGFFYQNKYENFFSDNFLTTEDYFKPILSKMMNSTDPVKSWKSKTSKTMDLDSPSESDTALISEISEFTYHWGHLFPRQWKQYFNKYLFLEDISNQELDEWKKNMQSLLNKIYMKKSQGRLLIKNPGDTARIKHLLEIYPSAKFIFIHRNPYDVFYSNLKLWTHVIHSVSLQEISKEEIKDIVLKVYRKLHQQYLEQNQLLRSDQLVETSYEKMIESPINSLQEIYQKLGLSGFQKALPFFTSYIDATLDGKISRYRNFPDDISKINQQWDFAFDRWKYPKMDPDALTLDVES